MEAWIFLAVVISLINCWWVFALNRMVCRLFQTLIEAEERKILAVYDSTEQKLKDAVKVKA
jgi:hypothetical protein